MDKEIEADNAEPTETPAGAHRGDSPRGDSPRGESPRGDSPEEAQREGSGAFGRFLRNLGILAAVFLVGFLMQLREVQTLRSSNRVTSAEVDQLRRDLEVERLGATLAGAALYASHGDYAPARQEAIRFFDGLAFLKMQVDEEQAETLVALAARRDDIVGSLGTGQSFGIYQLADVFARFQMDMTGRRYTFTVPTGLPPEMRHD